MHGRNCLTTILLYGETTIHYSLVNTWNHQLGRLGEYNERVTIPQQYYVIVPNCFLVGINHVVLKRCVVVPESINKAPSSELLRLAILKSLLLRPMMTMKGAVCSLIHEQSCHYFHWFIDILPRVIYGINYIHNIHPTLKYIIPSSLTSWQRDSLQLLGVSPSNAFEFQQLSVNSKRSVKVDYVICGNKHNYSGGSALAGDRLSPDIYKEISSRIKQNLPDLPDYPARRILISRRFALERRILNESQIFAKLRPFGFKLVVLEDLSFREQVMLFSNATHIIGVHGAGLTNLLFAINACVFEIHVLQHGIRPEYFQLATINDLTYCFASINAENSSNDIVLDESMIDSYLDNYVIL